MNANPLFSDEVTAQMERSRVVAVLVIDDAADAYPLARALLDGGIEIMELTLRTPAAIEALKQIRTRVPEMTAGIGTILTVEQVEQVVVAGAAFGVAPGYNPRILEAARERGLSFAPGVCTPTEIEWAIEAGCRIMKFFPAESLGGLKTLSAMAAPYAHLGVRFIPLGGIDVENCVAYLKNPAILAVGGSWIAKRDDIRKQNWSGITSRASEVVAAVEALKGRQ